MSNMVSIVIPVYNNTEYVRIMLDSIVSQEYQDWELLLVDDGSEEQTMQLLLQFSKTDRRIHVISRNRLPKGAQTCRNIGMDMAKGKYIIFFDSDDYVAPFSLAQRVAYMDKYEELDFAIFPSKIFRGSDYNNGKLFTGVEPYFYDDLFWFLLPRLPFVVWNNIYRLEYLRQWKIRWDEQVLSWQDSDFNIQNILAGAHYRYAKSPCIQADYFYRQTNSDSISKKMKDERHFCSHLYLYEKMICLVRAKHGSKYDKVLKKRAITFFVLMSRRGMDTCYIEELKKILRKNFGFTFLIMIQCRLFSFFSFLFNYHWAKYLSFPSLIYYYFLYIIARKISVVRYYDKHS